LFINVERSVLKNHNQLYIKVKDINCGHSLLKSFLKFIFFILLQS